MSVTVTKAGPYYSTGSISFSSLRNNFKETSSSISASELIRNTNVNEANPIVPDSTENENISTGFNLKLSQFRNSIKRYFATQSGTDNNSLYPTEPGFRMGRYDLNARGIDWCGGGYNGRDGKGGGTTGNITKNVQKTVYITGVCGSYYINQPAAQLETEVVAHNVKIEVSGEIYGAGGEEGTLSNLGGTSGGPALNVVNANGLNIVVNVQSSAKIYGGGGGGEKGAYGSIGDSGSCWNYTTKSVGSGCGSCGDCGSGWERYGGCADQGGCNCGGWWLWSGCSSTSYSTAECRQPIYYTVTGGAGGEGGNGGKGQGYNHNKTNGSIGSIGLSGSCAGYTGTGTLPGTGYTGETGGNGGDWGQPGTNTNSSADGSPAGRSITGSNYSVTGEINSSTVKGLYKP
jgi:hypothetical protein